MPPAEAHTRRDETAASVRDAVDRLLAARERLARRSVDAIAAALDRVVAVWLDPESSCRARAEPVLEATTGFSVPMLRRGLPLMLEPLRGASLLALLDDELGDWRRLERQPGAGGVRSPRLVTHMLPGNIPGLAAPAICLSLAVRSAALVKPGAGDRCFAGLFAESVAEIDPVLGDCVAACYWPGGPCDAEGEAVARADVVEAAGSDAAVAALRARVPGRFVGRGNRISFAFVAGEVAADPRALSVAAQAVAEDVAIWDQQGCLSPQVVFVERVAPAALDRTAEALGAALERQAGALPPRHLTLDEQAAVLRFRQQAEWGGGDAGAGDLLCGDALAWTIAVEPRAALLPTCLHRTVRLQPVRSLDEVVAALEPMRAWLEGGGLAVDPARQAAVAAALSAAGVHRVCAVGAMQRPDLTWKPGGRPRVADWMEVAPSP